MARTLHIHHVETIKEVAMKKKLLWIAAFIISAALVVVVTEARENGDIYEISSTAYVPPVLKESVRPEPVSYAPGRYVEGFVTLELKIGPSGKVEGVTVLYRTSALAVKSAVGAVEKWTFEPATLHGEPVTSYVAYSVPFGNNLPIFANKNYADRILDPVNGDQVAIK